MVIILLSATPAALRGALTRWLLEIDPGVYVGHLSARVREHLWELIQKHIENGRALLIYSTRSEQHFAIKSLGHDRIPVDLEGCLVMRTPYDKRTEGSAPLPGSVKPAKEAWSIAARRRRFRNSTERALGQQ
ncbi:type I-E CRISPR-associated endoribonuclease Cas2e [uncultured Propionibacterium sp.]|uniref:type I-E CRISPR-associated endoribonuclease Cas2e n=1 Tax=uncultured Propionibacterium sp. TaxID=218066 RepID=UPI00292FB3A8|nr:type I-E CRISPR-associated endoribonuclease Cas2e [uncultured Propionibacterium sp.]